MSDKPAEQAYHARGAGRCNRCQANLCDHDNCTDWTCARACSKCAKGPCHENPSAELTALRAAAASQGVNLTRANVAGYVKGFKAAQEYETAVVHARGAGLREALDKITCQHCRLGFERLANGKHVSFTSGTDGIPKFRHEDIQCASKADEILAVLPLREPDADTGTTPPQGWCTGTTPPPEECYVAWCRYKDNRILLCDSDAPKAFKVYRWATLAERGTTPPEGLFTQRHELTRAFFDLQMKRVHTWKRAPTQEELDTMWNASGLERGRYLDATVDFLTVLAATQRAPVEQGREKALHSVISTIPHNAFASNCSEHRSEVTVGQKISCKRCELEAAIEHREA